MKKKVVFLTLMLFWLSATKMFAQVNIGTADNPHDAAVLDLSQATNLGFLLPHIDLGDVSEFQLLIMPSEDQKMSAVGMTVYNTSATTKDGNGEGLYIWDGAKWRNLAINGGSMILSPATVPPIAAGGGDSGEITVASPAAEGFNGSYTFALIAGDDYAVVDPSSASDGKFSVTFYPNNSAVARRAIVLVTDPAGNTATFVFTQNANSSRCSERGGSKNPELTQTGVLGIDGAVYFSINAEENVDYIWTFNGAEAGSGATYIATQPGNYVVYGGAIGCTYKTSIILPSSGTAPDPVLSVVSSNGGIVCGAGGQVTLTALGAPSGAELAWFRDGVLLSSGQATSIPVSVPGSYFVAVKDAEDRYSQPSNTSTVAGSGNNSQVTLDANNVKVNGIPIANFNFYCKGSSLFLTVDAPLPGVTYTWYNGNEVIPQINPYIVPSDQNDILLRLVATDNSEALCPAEVNSAEKTLTSVAPASPTIIGNDRMCSGQNVTLSVSGAVDADSYEWYKDNEFLASNGGINSITISSSGSYKVRYKQSAGCMSDFSAPFDVHVQGAPMIEWSDVVSRVNPGTYTFSVRTTGNSIPTSYEWTAVQKSGDVAISTNLSNISGSTANLTFTGLLGTIELTVTPLNNCGVGREITQTITMIDQSLEAPTITPSSGSYCNGVNFKIAKPASWSQSHWLAFGLSNITSATLGSSSVLGTSGFSFDGTAYYYYIQASGMNQTASITVGGSVGAISVTPVSASVQVSTNTASQFSLSGRTCFDINTSNADAGSGRPKADFTSSYTYSLSGSLGSGVTISNVVWTYTNPHNAVKTFTPAGSSSTITNNSVTVKYDPALLNDATIGATGIVVTIKAIITTAGGSCTAVYAAEIPVTIKDALQCCPGIVIKGGVHNGPTIKNINDGTKYSALLSSQGFSRNTAKDLCIYYRDASSNTNWQPAVTNCSNASAVDAAHRAMGGWRLPNIAELAQMDATSTAATWSPRGLSLTSWPDRDSRTTNYSGLSWSSTEQTSGASGNALNWEWNSGTNYTKKDKSNVYRSYRCVRAMN